MTSHPIHPDRANLLGTRPLSHFRSSAGAGNSGASAAPRRPSSFPHKPSAPASPAAPLISSRLCVKNLPDGFSASDLRSHFSSHGVVTDCKLMSRDGKSRHFAFVGFSKAAEAAAAQKFFNRSFIRTNRLEVEFAQPQRSAALSRPWSKYSASSSRNPQARQALSAAWTARRLESQKDFNERKKRLSPAELRRKYFLMGLDESRVAALDSDPKFFEYLSVMKRGKFWENDDAPTITYEQFEEKLAAKEREKLTGAGDSDDEEYFQNREIVEDSVPAQPGKSQEELAKLEEISDLQYMKDRISDTLDDEDDDDEDEEIPAAEAASASESEEIPASPQVSPSPAPPALLPIPVPPRVSVPSSTRLFIRNLPYSVSEVSVREIFHRFGPIVEVFLPTASGAQENRGFAFVKFSNPSDAAAARSSIDGSIELGRILHVTPADERQLSGKAQKAWGDWTEEEKSALPYKKRKELEQKWKAEQSTNWNSLYVRSDAAVAALASQLGLSKDSVLDPTAGGAALGVKTAIAETRIVQQIKAWLKDRGVRVSLLEVPKASVQRSFSIILVKNLPFETSEGDLRTLFARFGTIAKLLLPPSRTLAFIEFQHSREAKAAFQALAYTKFKFAPLFLEWAPEGILDGETTEEEKIPSPAAPVVVDSDSPLVSLFVKNLNFSTSAARLQEFAENKIGRGTIRAVKLANKKMENGETVSQGFGFLELRKDQEAAKAIEKIHGQILDGHTLEVKLAGSTTTRVKAAKIPPSAGTKILVKNLPFEATKHELRDLFAAFGAVKKVRLPKKFDGAHRGFAFLDFATHAEAAKALEAIGNTHFYGRHLVLEWAKDDETEILGGGDSGTGGNLEGPGEEAAGAAQVAALREKTKRNVDTAERASSRKRQKIISPGEGEDFD